MVVDPTYSYLSRKPVFSEAAVKNSLEKREPEDVLPLITSILSMYQTFLDDVKSGYLDYEDCDCFFPPIERVLLPYLQRDDIDYTQETRYLPVETVLRLRERILSKSQSATHPEPEPPGAL